jgi:hypothetical protein
MYQAARLLNTAEPPYFKEKDMGRYQHQDWPSWRYGPDGEAKIFQSAADVPEGWEDTPAAAAAKKGTEKKVAKKSSPKRAKATADEVDAEEARYRAEVIEFLKATKVEFDESMTTEQLEALMEE